ncbi:unnamed protein product [Dracunculus medinensis]|uniref:PDZ domain-containing protein n=1 Tax=Dracunculus medinensis TaxID=318479 RepID=A0A158Q2K2_DRAME|nr:unnamed protein product [Dracunculus medinensis]
MPLSGFIIHIVYDSHNKIFLYGTPADRAGLCIGDQIIEVNETPIQDKSHNEIPIYLQCIKSKVIQLRIRRKQNMDSNCLHSDRSFRVSDAFFVSVDKDHAKEIGRKLKRLAFPKFMPNIQPSIMVGTGGR